MTRRYGDLILVAQQSGTSYPRCFIWRGITYHVVAVLATWHLMDRWWSSAPQTTEVGASLFRSLAARDDRAELESDRHYFRLDCSPGLLCDLYFDAAAERWILDGVFD